MRGLFSGINLAQIDSSYKLSWCFILEYDMNKCYTKRFLQTFVFLTKITQFECWKICLYRVISCLFCRSYLLQN